MIRRFRDWWLKRRPAGIGCVACSRGVPHAHAPAPGPMPPDTPPPGFLLHPSDRPLFERVSEPIRQPHPEATFDHLGTDHQDATYWQAADGCRFLVDDVEPHLTTDDLIVVHLLWHGEVDW